MTKTILLVEDTLSIRHLLVNLLKKEGYIVLASDTAENAMALMSNNEQDINLLLLDLMLPGMSGQDFLSIFQQKYDAPVIIISAINDEAIQTGLYQSRIDDYVVKPFSINILLLKIEALFRRISENKVTTVQYNDLEVDINNYQVSYKKKNVVVTAKEFDLLQALIFNQGKVFTRQELLESIWGYDFLGDSRTIDVHIKNLRKKFYPELITTVKNVGYKIQKI